MEAHALGEVRSLGSVLLGVYSGTLLPMFIEIGSYMTDKEQKNKLAQFFLRHSVHKHKFGIYTEICCKSNLVDENQGNRKRGKMCS